MAACPTAYADRLEAAADQGRSQAGPGWTLRCPSGPEVLCRVAGSSTPSYVAIGGRSVNLGPCSLICERRMGLRGPNEFFQERHLACGAGPTSWKLTGREAMLR